MTPYFQDFASFVAMGKHGVYVWTCYALVLMAVVFGVAFVRFERKKIAKKIARQWARRRAQEQHQKERS